jgi:uncharacterized protein (DUF2141 family)
MRLRELVALAIVATAMSWGLAAQVSRDSGVMPPPVNTGTGLIMGTVTMAGSGQPVEGVRVTLNGVELRGTRSALTNDDGQFVFSDLPAGTYTARATLTGHISGTYGQKQPGKPGTSIVLAAGQQLKNVSFEIAKGGVISGSVFDEKSRPSIGTPVRVMRWLMQSGERILTTAGNGTTDDRGIYRIYNLSPGDYLVSAVPRNTTGEVFTAEIDSGGRVVSASGTGAGEPVQGYASVFYPGTTQLAAAQAVRVGIAEERLGIDFGLQRAALSTITGQVVVPNGQSPTTIQIRLLQAESGALGIGQQTARPAQNGSFSFRSVVPGQYTLFATASVVEPRAPGQAPTPVVLNQQPASQRRIWAQADVFVDGAVPSLVSLTMQEGLPLSGHITFDGTAPQPTGNQRVRVMLNPLGTSLPLLGVGNLSANVDASGRFTIDGVIPGRYRVSASGAQGWSVKSVIANGVDVLDFPFDIAAGENAPNVTIQFGDRNTDLKGVLTDAAGTPSSDYSVVIFPDDQRYWVPFARRMRSTRPATDGKFAFVGLPPGEYRIAAVTDVETGEWLDPEFLRQLLPASVSVRLADGQQVTQDIRVR